MPAVVVVKQNQRGRIRDEMIIVFIFVTEPRYTQLVGVPNSEVLRDCSRISSSGQAAQREGEREREMEPESNVKTLVFILEFYSPGTRCVAL